MCSLKPTMAAQYTFRDLCDPVSASLAAIPSPSHRPLTSPKWTTFGIHTDQLTDLQTCYSSFGCLWLSCCLCPEYSRSPSLLGKNTIFPSRLNPNTVLSTQIIFHKRGGLFLLHWGPIAFALLFSGRLPETSLVAQMVKVSAYNEGDLSSIPESGRYSGEGNGNPLQYSCLENPMDRGAWSQSDMTEWLHFFFPGSERHSPQMVLYCVYL